MTTLTLSPRAATPVARERVADNKAMLRAAAELTRDLTTRAPAMARWTTRNISRWH